MSKHRTKRDPAGNVPNDVIEIGPEPVMWTKLPEAKARSVVPEVAVMALPLFS
jgi:hypothetical protein